MPFSSFCKLHPALVHSIFFLLGLGFIYNLNPWFFLPLFFLLFFIKKKAPSYIVSSLIFFISAVFYGHVKKESFPPLRKGIQGSFLFVPSEIKTHRSHFKKMELLKGSITSLDTTQKVNRLPCSILYSSQNHPKIHSSYYIEGSLEKKGESSPFFSFKPDPSKSWTPVPYSFSLTQVRFDIKEYLSKKISSFFSNPKVIELMGALTLGTLEDRMMKFDFARLGLQHVLTISGFHFGLLACLLGLFFRLVCTKKAAYLALFLSLTLYFILLGHSPSIFRAYLGSSLYLLSQWSGFKANALNLLGVTLLLELLIDPQVIPHLGFQLSFLSTFSILFLLPVTKRWSSSFFPKRTSYELLLFSSFERGAYLLCCFLRSAFALNLSVSLTTLPVCLFYFHKFPWMSLFYNLFIPLFFSFSLLLFFVSVPCSLMIPPLSSFLNLCNQKWTEGVLNLTSQSPIYLDLYLHTPSFPLPILFLSLLGVFSLPFITLKKRKSHSKVQNSVYSSY